MPVTTLLVLAAYADHSHEVALRPLVLLLKLAAHLWLLLTLLRGCCCVGVVRRRVC